MENRTTTRTGKKKKPFTQWPSWMTMRSARPAPPPRLAVPPRRRAPATAGQPLPPPPPTKTAPRRRAPAHGRRGNRRTGWRAARWCRGQGQNPHQPPPFRRQRPPPHHCPRADHRAILQRRRVDGRPTPHHYVRANARGGVVGAAALPGRWARASPIPRPGGHPLPHHRHDRPLADGGSGANRHGRRVAADNRARPHGHARPEGDVAGNVSSGRNVGGVRQPGGHVLEVHYHSMAVELLSEAVVTLHPAASSMKGLARLPHGHAQGIGRTTKGGHRRWHRPTTTGSPGSGMQPRHGDGENSSGKG